MTLRVVGAGLGRTGTLSLKLALERLLGEPCYHMVEVLSHPEHIPLWYKAFKGNTPDWNKIFNGFKAAVDEPASCFWKEISQAFPNALVILSVRDAESWWKSADKTIFNDVAQAHVHMVGLHRTFQHFNTSLPAQVPQYFANHCF